MIVLNYCETSTNILFIMHQLINISSTLCIIYHHASGRQIVKSLNTGIFSSGMDSMYCSKAEKVDATSNAVCSGEKESLNILLEVGMWWFYWCVLS